MKYENDIVSFEPSRCTDWSWNNDNSDYISHRKLGFFLTRLRLYEIIFTVNTKLNYILGVHVLFVDVKLFTAQKSLFIRFDHKKCNNNLKHNLN